MARRKESETVQVGLRVKESLRAGLEEAARARGVSMNAEVVARLERSLSEENAFGGPEMRRLAYLMIVAFARAGDLRAAGKPNWINDRDCYRAGMFGAIDALLIGLPDATAEEVALEIEGLKSRLLSRIAREEHDK